MLRSGGGDYLLYNTCRIPLKWEEMSEYRALELLQSELHTKLRPIMLGHTMDVAYDLLTGNTKKNSTAVKVTASTSATGSAMYTPMVLSATRLGIR